MLTNDTFATTVAVAVPVILLALGAESRDLDKRTRPERGVTPVLLGYADRITQKAEQELERYPDASPDWTSEEIRRQWNDFSRVFDRPGAAIIMRLVPWTYLTTILWALTIICLSVTEVWNLVWLSGHQTDGSDSSALAWLSVVSIALSMMLLFASPALRLLWFQIPSFESLYDIDTDFPESVWRKFEQKFGAPSGASPEERRSWLKMMDGDSQ